MGGGAVIALLVTMGVLIVTSSPQLMIMAGLDKPDFGITQTLDKDTNAWALSSGEFSFSYSNSLGEINSASVNFNGRSVNLPKGAVVELDDHFTVMYVPSAIQRFSFEESCAINIGPRDACPPQYQIIVPGAVRSITKTFNFYVTPGLVSVNFSDDINTLPNSKPYVQNVVTKNLYGKRLIGTISYNDTETSIAGLPLSPVSLPHEFGLDQGELDIPVFTFTEGGRRLEVQPRVVLFLNNEPYATLPQESIARSYDVKRNIASAFYDPGIPTKERTKFFSREVTVEPLSASTEEIEQQPSVISNQISGVSLPIIFILSAIVLGLYIFSRRK